MLARISMAASCRMIHQLQVAGFGNCHLKPQFKACQPADPITPICSNPVDESHGTRDTSATVEQHACSQCGAKLDFAPGTSACSSAPIAASRCQFRSRRQPIFEADYRAFLEKAGQEKESYEAQRIHCEKCGAETTMPRRNRRSDLSFLRREHGFFSKRVPPDQARSALAIQDFLPGCIRKLSELDPEALVRAGQI